MTESNSTSMTAKQFAQKMEVNYRTALRWLENGLVQGAERKNSPVGEYWDIPAAALEMERPKSGRPAKAKVEIGK